MKWLQENGATFEYQFNNCWIKFDNISNQFQQIPIINLVPIQHITTSYLEQGSQLF
jgi:hypothetical protein